MRHFILQTKSLAYISLCFIIYYLKKKKKKKKERGSFITINRGFLWFRKEVKRSWLDLVEWTITHSKALALELLFVKLAWWVAIYYLWKQRNAIIHSRKIKTSFLSTRFINTDRTSLLWLRYLYISILFFGCKTFMLCLY